MDDVNIIFCRILLSSIRPEVEDAGFRVNRDASVYAYSTYAGHVGHRQFQFAGPGGFVREVSASNGYHARYLGWMAFLGLEENAI